MGLCGKEGQPPTTLHQQECGEQVKGRYSAAERLHLRVVCPAFDTPVLEVNKILSPEEGP